MAVPTNSRKKHWIGSRLEQSSPLRKREQRKERVGHCITGLTVNLGNLDRPTPFQSAGFTLPDGSLISPDAAWIAHDRWLALTDEQHEEYAPIVPDVVIEIASKTDRPAALRAKLERCRALGAAYVLLLDPYREELWNAGEAPEGLRLTLDTLR